MNRDLKREIVSILNEKLELKLAPADVTNEASIQDLGMTSMHLMKMIYLIEDQVGVKLATDDILVIETIGDLVELLEAKLGASAV